MLVPRLRKISSPPIVGVPAFVACFFTSGSIYCPHFTLCSQEINAGPTIMVIMRAVIKAPIERKDI
jgi:hypothetical protein